MQIIFSKTYQFNRILINFPVEPFNCVGHPDGNYENPAHSCREIFFSCVSGASFVRLCSSATLRYDAMTDQCLSPA